MPIAFAAMEMPDPLGARHTAGRATTPANREIEHAGGFLTLRLFKSEQPLLVAPGLRSKKGPSHLDS